MKKKIKHSVFLKFGNTGDIVQSIFAISYYQKLNPNSKILILTDSKHFDLFSFSDIKADYILVNSSGLYSGNLIKKITSFFALFFKININLYKFKIENFFIGYKRNIYCLLFIEYLFNRFKFRLIPNKNNQSLALQYHVLLNGEKTPFKNFFDFIDEYRIIQRSKVFTKYNYDYLLFYGGNNRVTKNSHLRNLDSKHFIELLRSITKNNRVALAGFPDDYNFDLKGLNFIDLRGKTSYNTILDIIASSRKIITVDSGSLHLAYLVNADVYCFFGPTDPKIILPTHSNITFSFNPKNLSCCPCYDGQEYADCSFNECINGLPNKHYINFVKEKS